MSDRTKTTLTTTIDNVDARALLTCTDRFICLRLMAQVFGHPELEKIALLGEEISSKSAFAHTQHRMKGCTDALWDALTTVKHVVANGVSNSDEELRILVRRLEKQLSYVRSLDTAPSIQASYGLEQDSSFAE
jgi:hypothetical protein